MTKVIYNEDMNIPNLTFHKVYDVYEFWQGDNGNKCFYLKNDLGKLSYYHVSYFMNLTEWRDKQIDSILNDE